MEGRGEMKEKRGMEEREVKGKEGREEGKGWKGGR